MACVPSGCICSSISLFLLYISYMNSLFLLPVQRDSFYRFTFFCYFAHIFCMYIGILQMTHHPVRVHVFSPSIPITPHPHIKQWTLQNLSHWQRGSRHLCVSWNWLTLRTEVRILGHVNTVTAAAASDEVPYAHVLMHVHACQLQLPQQSEAGLILTPRAGLDKFGQLGWLIVLNKFCLRKWKSRQ